MVLGGLVATCAWLYLCFSSQHYGDASLLQLLSVSGIVTLASLSIWWHHHRTGNDINLAAMLAFALLFRVIGFATFPILEDDFYRFLWDGFQTSTSGSPYAVPPAHFFGSELSPKFELILDSINYPESATIYGPSTQWMFFLSYQLAPGGIWPLKLFSVIADIAIIVLLLKTTSRPVLLLYVWSPLVIKEFVISVHPDIVGALFLTLALKAYTAKKDITMGTLLALALGVKLFVIIIVPFLVLFRWRAWLGLLISATVIAWPFGLQNAWLPSGLNTMSSGWLFNAPLYELLNAVAPSSHTTLILLTAFTVVAGSYGLVWLCKAIKNRRNNARPIPRGDYLFALLFICIPALNPWYAIWLAPFVLRWPSIWAWVGSVSLILSYASGINLPLIDSTAHSVTVSTLANYQHPAWVLIVEFGSIAVALVYSVTRSKYTKHNNVKSADAN